MNLKTIRYAVVGLLALFVGGAFADGVPLLTQGVAIKANDPVAQSMRSSAEGFVKLHPIALNKAALSSNVLTVVIEGKEYRFVGAPGPVVKGAPIPIFGSASEVARAVAKREPDLFSWSGRSGTPGAADYGTLNVAWDSNGMVAGSITLPPARGFMFTTRPVMVERDITKSAAFKMDVVKSPNTPASGNTLGVQK